MKSKTKILIVDDDVEFADSLKDLIEFKGFDAGVVYSGSDALSRVEKEHFDIVLMDIKMPVMNGVETLKRIKKIRLCPAVIMMTGFSVESLINDALKEGAFAVLDKPLNIPKLLQDLDHARTVGGLIMIYADDTALSQTLKDVFESRGYRSNAAASLEDGLKLSRVYPADIIFLDMKLPPFNGLEAYLTIRSFNSKASVILMAGPEKETEPLVRAALEKGAHACLHKPFDPKEAAGLIEEIMRQKEAR